MAEKKKSLSDARPRAKKPVAEVAASPAAEVAAAPVGAVEPAVTPKRRAPRSSRAKGAPVAAAALAVAPTDDTLVAPPRPTDEAIRRRAYEIFRERGGNAFDNWLQAERELSG